MQSVLWSILCVLTLAASDASTIATPASAGNLIQRAHTKRFETSELEIGGDLRGLPTGSTRYLGREDLLTLPQVTYTVSDDSNFTEPTRISGVLLEELITRLANDPDRDLVIAECSDQYHAHYPHSYLMAHHPMLVLNINGQPPEHWPRDAEGRNLDMGPYLISHAEFKATFRLLSHEDQAQIPWGVVRLEFRDEKALLTAIAPPTRYSADPVVQTGYRIAQQNCLRCHNAGPDGGKQAHHPWLVLSAWATASPEHFARYVRFPQAENPNAQMHPNPNYDDATLQALTTYFRSLMPPPQEKP
jgi:mono/diheme cytochrome c family protein